MRHHQAIRQSHKLLSSRNFLPTLCPVSRTPIISSPRRRLATVASSPVPHFSVKGPSSASSIPHLSATDLTSANDKHHVQQVSSLLAQQGMLKVSLSFPDSESQYLQNLIISLNKHHDHKLPISHSASRGWFWDVRPSQSNFQTENHQARSETMEEFPWHTDCSYEDPTPRYFALQVLQHDRFGGGTLSVMNVARLMERLSHSTREALQQPHFKISIPGEFIKDPEIDHIIGKTLSTDGGKQVMRFRQDILSPMTPAAEDALAELNAALGDTEIKKHATVHLTADDLPKGTVVLIDNWRWLHARNDVKDPERHLRRVRWDAIPFGESVMKTERLGAASLWARMMET